MSIVQVNADDGIGGAARACYRLHRGLIDHGLESRLVVRVKTRDDPTVFGPTGFLSDAWARMRPFVAQPLFRLHGGPRSGVHSLNVVRSGLPARIASLRPELVHLHLISRETMSIAEVGRIKAPLVWTFHDMWAFAGTEHYPEPETHTRFQGGYLANEGGIDLSRWTWRRKQRHWNTGAMTIVTPSRWMGDCVANSRLFEGARVEVIPNGIDTNQFKPLDRSFARQALNLPQDPPLILFGAMNATSDRRKGFDLLMEALGRVAANTVGPKPELLVFGSSGHAGGPDYGLKTHFAGRVQDASSLALLYAASDVFVAPSRQDNLPNTIVETLASGTPAVAFNIGGMPDMIDHQQNGFLAQPFDAAELAAGISWVLATNAESGRLREAARKKVEDTFTIGHQVRACTALYEDLLDRPLRQQEVPGAASVV